LHGYSKLGGRARNILSDLQLDRFEYFYQTVIEKHKILSFNNIRSCGIKTRAELESFIKGILQPDDPRPAGHIQDEITSNWLLRKKFELLFKRQPGRIRQALRSCEADSFEEFYYKLIKQQGTIKLFSNRKSSYLSEREIVNFQRKISRNIMLVKKYNAHDMVLASLDFLLRRDNTFSDIERYILKHRLHFISGGKHVKQVDIGRLFKLSGERVRQITRKLLNTIDNLLSEYKQVLKPDLSYYHAQALNNDGPELEKMLNEREGTRFGLAFIQYALKKLSS
jgi:hypothetical protein